ncbi:MAG TPA: hypothetical protein VGZ68_10490 [Acidimicrobiales bacterium]|jgi:hypothetical protein|nr:hypothetical protein [Acidimicrobiales bacterium]
MNEADGRETRQLLMMRDTLRFFESGEITISTAVTELKSLVWELETVSDDWRDHFIGEWFHLEIEYASALSSGITPPDARYPGIRIAVARMSEMIEERLDVNE